jgi:SAM-dependent methyltransferase
MGDESRAFWDRYWTDAGLTLEAVAISQVLDRTKLEYLRPLLPGAGRTLEVGAGSARLSCWLATAGYRTVCLDYAPGALAAARANYAAARVPGGFVAGDAFGVPFRERAFDVVLSTGLLEHFVEPTPIVREMVRVLRPGGLFYSDIVPRKFSLFRSLDWVGRLRRGLAGRPAAEDGFFERRFSAREIAAMLEACGLERIHVFPAGVVPPYLPVLSRSARGRALQVRLVERTRLAWAALDGTRVATWLGFYYFAWAVKPERPA